MSGKLRRLHKSKAAYFDWEKATGTVTDIADSSDAE